MSNSLVSDCIRTILGDLKIEATAGNVSFVAGLSVLLPADPTVPLGAATKQYVDAVASGLNVKESVRATTDTTLAATRSGDVITATGNGAISIDGVSLSAGNRVLVKDGLVGGDAEVKEVTELTCVAKASYTDNTASTADYFDISTHLNTNRYRVYFDFSGANGNQPPADGRTLTRVNISGDTTSTDVATTLSGVLTGLANLGAISAIAVVTATNSTAGDAEDAVGATAVSSAGMTIVVTPQGVSDGASNGVYTVTTVGDAGTAYVLTRATDADDNFEVTSGLFTFTEEGTVNADIGYVLITNDPLTINFTAQTFAQFSTHGGTVVGPAGGSTDHALVRWDTTTGKLVQDSIGILSDAGVLTGLTVIGSAAGTSPLTINSGTGDLNLVSTDEINLDASGVLELNSSGGIISIGNDAIAQNINIGTGAAARTVNLATGGAVYTLVMGSVNTTSTTTIQSGTGNIDIGTTAQARTVNLGTGGAVQTVVVGSVNTTSPTLIQSGTGNITLTPAGTATIDTTKVLDIQGGITFGTGNITGATAPGIADSGTIYTVQQTSAYAITLPNPVLPGTSFKFMLDTAGAFAVTITNGDAELFGTIIDGVPTVIAGVGHTLTFDPGAAVGDSIEIYGIDATTYWFKAVTSVTGGITIDNF